jgi:hypothetical protein
LGRKRHLLKAPVVTTRCGDVKGAAKGAVLGFCDLAPQGGYLRHQFAQFDAYGFLRGPGGGFGGFLHALDRPGAIGLPHCY